MILVLLLGYPTVCVTRAGAGGGTPSDWKNAEAWKRLGIAPESPASGARFVGLRAVVPDSLVIKDLLANLTKFYNELDF